MPCLQGHQGQQHGHLCWGQSHHRGPPPPPPGPAQIEREEGMMEGDTGLMEDDARKEQLQTRKLKCHIPRVPLPDKGLPRKGTLELAALPQCLTGCRGALAAAPRVPAHGTLEEGSKRPKAGVCVALTALALGWDPPEQQTGEVGMGEHQAGGTAEANTPSS